MGEYGKHSLSQGRINARNIINMQVINTDGTAGNLQQKSLQKKEPGGAQRSHKWTEEKRLFAGSYVTLTIN